MNWYWLMYAFVVLERFQVLLIVLSFLFGALFLITTIYRLPHQWSNNNYGAVDYIGAVKRWWWISMVGLITFCLSAIFVPTKKDVAIIILGGAIGEFVENDDNVKKLPADLFMLLRKELLEEVADLPDEFKRGVEDKLGVSLESEEDKLKKMSQEELIQLYLKKETETTNRN
jgi:hypothetical protein